MISLQGNKKVHTLLGKKALLSRLLAEEAWFGRGIGLDINGDGIPDLRVDLGGIRPDVGMAFMGGPPPVYSSNLPCCSASLITSWYISQSLALMKESIASSTSWAFNWALPSDFG